MACFPPLRMCAARPSAAAASLGTSTCLSNRIEGDAPIFCFSPYFIIAIKNSPNYITNPKHIPTPPFLKHIHTHTRDINVKVLLQFSPVLLSPLEGAGEHSASDVERTLCLRGLPTSMLQLSAMCLPSQPHYPLRHRTLRCCVLD